MEQTKKSLLDKISAWIKKPWTVRYCPLFHGDSFVCIENQGYKCPHPAHFNECRDFMKRKENPREYQISN